VITPESLHILSFFQISLGFLNTYIYIISQLGYLRRERFAGMF
jgi:hypothetical protein